MIVGTVYLLHFDSPVKGKSHYVGFTQGLTNRLHAHGEGLIGSQMTNLAVKDGIRVLLGKTWANVTADKEKGLKKEKNFKRHCKACLGLPSIVVCAGKTTIISPKLLTQSEAVGLVPPKAG